MGEPLTELSFRRLLVAVDGSENADLALSAAITAARRDHAAITLVDVAPDDDADAYARRVLRAAIEQIPEDGRVGALLGSVSNHVRHHATISVFVAHAPRA